MNYSLLCPCYLADVRRNLIFSLRHTPEIKSFTYLKTLSSSKTSLSVVGGVRGVLFKNSLIPNYNTIPLISRH